MDRVHPRCSDNVSGNDLWLYFNPDPVLLQGLIARLGRLRLSPLGCFFRLSYSNCQGLCHKVVRSILDSWYNSALFVIKRTKPLLDAFASSYKPQICALKYIVFLLCNDRLWVIRSVYFPSSPCLFFSDVMICVLLKMLYSAPAACGSFLS